MQASNLTAKARCRCQHFHYSPHLFNRLLLAQLLRAGFRFIRHFDDQLLPVIHQNWVPMAISMRRTLTQRSASITSPEKLIVAAELRTVATMSELSREFVRQKLEKELDELLGDYLRDVASISTRTSSVYTHTSAFKLQAAIFEW